mmetsp:Transcript_20650/g.62835  ORF Transcript_20650/g.62835 Transcript_20650/m.62835 type:complete len:170 (-) Transcript_20650:33-542(-)
MRYIPDAEEGDPDRHYIGGTGAMYRTARYVGEWADGERTGMGKTWRSDGTSLEGEFYRGHVDGDAVYTYPSGRWRTAFYMRGDFRRWTSELQDPVTLTLTRTLTPTLALILSPLTLTLTLGGGGQRAAREGRGRGRARRLQRGAPEPHGRAQHAPSTHRLAAREDARRR